MRQRNHGVARAAVVVASLLCCLTILTAAPQFRARVDAVFVDVTVTNRQGTFAVGLTKEDFEVFDNGRRQQISGFTAGELPLRLALVLDTSWSMARHIQRFQAVAKAFIQTIRPEDAVAIGSLTKPGILRHDPLALDGDLKQLPESEGSRVWRSFAWSAAAVAEGEGRRAVLLGTDGQDTDDVSVDFGFIRRSASPDDAQRALELADAQLYLIVPSGLRVPSKLKQLSENSGGRLLQLDRNVDLLSAWQNITTELRHQYLLSFPATEQDGKLHRIEVKVKRRDMRVRSRRTYRAAVAAPAER
jgi:Ca-activated chloride channel family protein